jgi:hypothetical protein
MRKQILNCATVLLLAGSLEAAPAPTPLVHAVKNADAVMVRRLINDRVDVNASEADGTTALH